MSTLTKALRWGLHWLGEDAEARIRDLTRRAEGLQAAYDLLSVSAETERREEAKEREELHLMLADKAHVLQEYAKLRDEVARLRDRLTLRTFNARVFEERMTDALRERDDAWAALRGARAAADAYKEERDEARAALARMTADCEMQKRRIEELETLLAQAERKPSPMAQPWTGGSGPLDPAQQWGADALQRVTQERDALREAHREAQEALRDQEAATGNALQQRDDLARALHAAAVRLSKEHVALEQERDAAIASRDAAREEAARLRMDARAFGERLADAHRERDEAWAALNEAGKVLGAVCVASTLGPGESLKDPPQHAAVSAILSVIRERDITRMEAERLEQERDEAQAALRGARAALQNAQDVAAALRQERDEARTANDTLAGEVAATLLDLMPAAVLSTLDTGAAAALGLAAGFDAHRRLTQAAGTLRKWNWTEDAIESFFALPGEARTHVFPVVSPSGIRGIVSVILERDAARDALRSTMEEKDRLLVQIAHAQDATAALQLELGGWQKEALRLREAIQNARQELRQGRSRLADTILAGVLGPPTESLSGDLGSKAPEVGRSGPWPGSQEEPERTRNERVDDLKRRLGLRCEHNAKQGACTADGCSFGARR